MKENELQLLTALEMGVVNVVFTKADGTSRKMRCTRSKTLYTPAEPKDDRHVPNPEVAVVFDLEVGEIRSFCLDSVIEFKGE